MQSKKYKKIILRFTLSLTLILALLQAFIIYPFLNNNIEDLHNYYNLTIVSNFQNDLESLYTSTSEAALKVSTDPILVNCFFGAPHISEHAIFERLKVYTGMNHISSVYIYNALADKVYSSYDEGRVFNRPSFSDIEALEYLESTPPNRLSLYMRVKKSETPVLLEESIFTMVFKPDVCGSGIIINVSPSYLTELLRKYNLLKAGAFLVYDANGKIVYGGKHFGLNDDIKNTGFFIDNNASEPVSLSVDGERYTVVHTYSKHLNYHFSWFIPKSRLARQIFPTIITAILIITIMVLFLGVLTAFFVTRRMSKQVEKIFNYTLNSKLKKTRTFRILSVLTRQQLKTDDIEELSIEFPIFAEKEILLVNVIFDNFNIFRTEYDESDRDLLLYGATNICVELFEKNGVEAIIDSTATAAEILIITKASNNVEQIIDECKKWLYQYLDYTVSFVISDPFPPNEVALAYEQINYLKRYKFILGANSVIFSNVSGDTKDKSNENLSEIIGRFSTQIAARDFVSFKQELKNLSNIAPHMEPLQARMLYIHVAFILLEAAPFLGVDKDSLLYEFTTAETIENSENLLLAMLDKLSANQPLILNAKTNKLLNDTISIIKTEYANKDLNVDMIARRLNVSSSHLSKLFKEKNNIKLVNYITNVRIREAQRLLCESSLSVSQIAHNVGFSSSEYFSTCFKKSTGVIPSMYRTSKLSESKTDEPLEENLNS